MTSSAEVAPSPPGPDDLPLTVVELRRRWAPLDLHEMWEFRELLYFLVWRDIKVRYKQTALGASWAVIQPFMMMIVFTIFLGHLAGVSSEGKPYPLFVFAALVPWTLFAQSLSGASGSLLGGANLVSKIYFPRVILPIASAGSFVVDFLLALLLLGGIMVYYGQAPSASIVWLPGLVVLALVTAFAVGIWLAALSVRYRDVRYTVPFLVQLWLFASPVAYSASIVPARWRLVYGLNPMAGVVQGFRWALVGTDTRPGGMIAVSGLVAVVLLVGGLVYFRRTEQTFADVI